MRWGALEKEPPWFEDEARAPNGYLYGFELHLFLLNKIVFIILTFTSAPNDGAEGFWKSGATRSGPSLAQTTSAATCMPRREH